MDQPVMTMRYFLELYLFGVAKILPIVNPFSTIPLLLALTPGGTAERRAREARRSSLYASMILVGSLLVGSLVIEFFGISLEALRIAGGLVISIIGLRMLFPGPEASTVHDPLGGQGSMDVALIPLAMPSLSGPGRSPSSSPSRRSCSPSPASRSRSSGSRSPSHRSPPWG